MPIQRLSPLLVSQIAAGEVVDRPASVVRECAENAIDAGASRIAVTIEGGGKDGILVVDDGEGIPPGDLAMAVAPHATSKITGVDDLDAVATMGFRGEALASIASVSRLVLTSKTAGCDEASTLVVEGGGPGTPRPVAAPPGTTVEVRTLFFNTPARRKFLKSDGAETARVTETLRRLAIAHPGITFTLRSVQRAGGTRTLLDLPSCADPAQRVLDILGPDLRGEMLLVEAEAHAMRLWGLAGRPGIARPTARHLRVHCNGRPISDRAITHAIREAYRGLIDPRRSPTVALFLSVDPRRVDVNVHPAKAEVRFRDADAVHRLIHRAVRACLHAADLVPTLATEGAPWHEAKPFGTGLAASSSGMPAVGLATAPSGITSTVSAPAPAMPVIRSDVPVLQVHDTFLVTPDEQGLLVIDQHALHERVLFERLLVRLGDGTLESQRLLVPATIEVDPGQVQALDEMGGLLGRLGIEANAMGPSSIAVHAFPSLLLARHVDPAAFLGDLLDKAAAGDLDEDPEAALHEVLDMMACKAAVKAGDRLSEREIADLLAMRERVERSERCPHGRPTTLRLTIEDMEKRFGRR